MVLFWFEGCLLYIVNEESGYVGGEVGSRKEVLGIEMWRDGFFLMEGNNGVDRVLSGGGYIGNI